jgi:hypothetical protein
MEPVILTGNLGQVYSPYTPFLMNGEWADIGGNYAFAYVAGGIVGPGRWVILYIGETESFLNRMPSHEVWAEAVGLGATHVLAHTNVDALARKSEERDVIACYQPRLNPTASLNTQHVPPLAGLAGAFSSAPRVTNALSAPLSAMRSNALSLGVVPRRGTN